MTMDTLRRLPQSVEEEMLVRAAIQELTLAHGRRDGYRRITTELRRRGLLVKHKPVARHDLVVYFNLAREGLA